MHLSNKNSLITSSFKRLATDMRLNIISWFGQGEALRNKRIAIHQRQVGWARSNGLDVRVFNQEYYDSDYIDGVDYVGYNNRRTPGEARNALLEEFYSSDEDYCMLADNDSVFRDISDFKFIEEFQNNIDQILKRKMGVITPLNPLVTPFNKEYESNKEFYDTHMKFKYNTFTKGSFYIIKNMAKHDKYPLYFDKDFTDIDGSLIPKEDNEFGIHALAKGLGAYYSMNIVLKEMASSQGSSTWAVDNSSRQDRRGDGIIVSKHDIPYLDYNKVEYMMVATMKDGTLKAYKAPGEETKDSKEIESIVVLKEPSTLQEINRLSTVNPLLFDGKQIPTKEHHYKKMFMKHPVIAKMEKEISVPINGGENKGASLEDLFT